MTSPPPDRLPDMETTNLADLYDLDPLAWRSVTDRLDRGVTQAPGTGGPDRHTCWLATIDADGRPHVTGIGALWLDGAFWFETGERTRKGRNVARDPRATISLSVDEFDVTVEGTVERITDPAVVAGYGTDVDRDLIRAWWSLRCLLAVRWLVGHGFGPLEEMPEIAVLRSQI
jgi:pyridoxine/pyridoxamine 5'-phosphate oxidase